MLTFYPKPFWLAAGILLTASSHLLANGLTAPIAVELNGCCSILGDRRAVLVVHPEAGAENIMLAEGESADGITLLAVNMTANCVRIENGGQSQTLRICSTPSLSPFADADGKAERFLARGLDGMVGSLGADGRVAETSPGNPGWGTLPQVPGWNGAITKIKATSSQDTNYVTADLGVSKAVDPIAVSKNQSNAQWYQESESIEANRRESASQVLAGEMEPWPRTPLTPAGTPSALVGPGMFFSNHVPRYVVTGSLN